MVENNFFKKNIFYFIFNKNFYFLYYFLFNFNTDNHFFKKLQFNKKLIFNKSNLLVMKKYSHLYTLNKYFLISYKLAWNYKYMKKNDKFFFENYFCNKSVLL